MNVHPHIATAGETIRIGQIEIRFLLEGAETGGSLALFEAVIPPNVRVPAPHRHVTFDETIWEVSGICTFTLEGRELLIGPGQALFIPRGANHQFVNRGPESVRLISAITPGVLSSQYFREVGAVINAGGPPDMALVAEIMARHGLQAT